MIYDDVLNITWMADVGIARNYVPDNLNWNGALQWAENLEFSGYDDWRLPSMDLNGDGTIVDCRMAETTELACRNNEYDYLLVEYGVRLSNPGDFINIGSLHYWSSTINLVFDVWPIC